MPRTKSRRSIDGHWWVRGATTAKLPGTLTIQERAPLRLRLFGDLVPGAETGRSIEILGELETGASCRLRDAFVSSRRYPQAGPRRTEVVANEGFLGRADLGDEQLSFHGAEFRAPMLDHWLARRAIATAFDPKAKRIAYNQPANIRIEIPAAGCTLELRSRASMHEAYSHARLQVAEFVGIQPSQPQGPEWYRELQHDLVRLLGVLQAVQAVPERLVLEMASQVAGDPAPNPIEYLWQRFRLRRREDSWPTHLIGYSEISTEFPAILEAWFERRESLRWAADLFFSAWRDGFVETRFLSLVHALEAFHRATRDGQYMAPEDYDPVWRGLLLHIPADVGASHRDALKSRLKYGNEWSLRRRLEELLDWCGPRLAPFLVGGDGDFLTRLITTRNFLVHRTQELSGLSWSVDEMRDRIPNLVRFGICVFLLQAGVSANVLEEALAARSAQIRWW